MSIKNITKIQEITLLLCEGNLSVHTNTCYNYQKAPLKFGNY